MCVFIVEESKDECRNSDDMKECVFSDDISWEVVHSMIFEEGEFWHLGPEWFSEQRSLLNDPLVQEQLENVGSTYSKGWDCGTRFSFICQRSYWPR